MHMDRKTNYKMEELLPLVSELAQQYAGCDSTSVTYEKAQALMEAVLYCLHEYDSAAGSNDTDSMVLGGNTGGNKTGSIVLCQDKTVREKYEAGRQLLLAKVDQILRMLNALSGKFEDYGVRSLYDTVQKGVPEFLKWYDVRFCPQDTILTLDYPLLVDLHTMCGADAVYAYLCGIQAEQRFLAMFDRGYIVSLLEAYDTEYREMMENICEIVLANAIGHLLLQKPFEDRGFQKEEYRRLEQMVGSGQVQELEQVVLNGIRQMAKQYDGDDGQVCTYLCAGAGAIAVRMESAARMGHLEHLLLL